MFIFLGLLIALVEFVLFNFVMHNVEVFMLPSHSTLVLVIFLIFTITWVLSSLFIPAILYSKTLQGLITDYPNVEYDIKMEDKVIIKTRRVSREFDIINIYCVEIWINNVYVYKDGYIRNVNKKLKSEIKNNVKLCINKYKFDKHIEDLKVINKNYTK